MSVTLNNVATLIVVAIKRVGIKERLLNQLLVNVKNSGHYLRVIRCVLLEFVTYTNEFCLY